jgi:glutaminyl-peptide cyclotransferase
MHRIIISIVIYIMAGYLQIFASNGAQFDNINQQLKQLLITNKIPEIKYRLINTHPHHSKRFTQGILMVNQSFYESTGLYQQSKIIQLELVSGKILKTKKLPSSQFGEGLTALGQNIYQITYREEIGYIYQMDTLQQLGYFNIKGEGWGLTNDGIHLILSNGSSTLTYLSPKDFKAHKHLSVCIGGESLIGINELQYINGKIFANILPTSIITIISPKSGQVEGWVDLAALKPSKETCDPVQCVANGIAFNQMNQHVLVTGKFWPHIYELTLIKPTARDIMPLHFKTIKFSI